MKKIMLATLLSFATIGSAHAGGQHGSIGVGGEYSVFPGAGGISVNYDAGSFHVGGLLGMDDPEGGSNTDFMLGARFYYHVHETAMSDFGVGLGLAWHSNDEPGAPERSNLLYFEPGFQVRMFVASNVALSLTGGISFGAIDADGVFITAQPNGIAGFHYYFF